MGWRWEKYFSVTEIGDGNETKFKNGWGAEKHPPNILLAVDFPIIINKVKVLGSKVAI